MRARGIAAALFAAMGTDEFPARFAEFSEHTRRWLADRRENPRDDMLTEMAGGVVQGKEIDEAAPPGCCWRTSSAATIRRARHSAVSSGTC